MQSRQFHHVTARGKHMATTFEFTISCETAQIGRAERALDLCHQIVAELENELTEFRPLSPIYRFNNAPIGENIQLSDRAFQLLQRAIRISKDTDGAFNVFAKSKMQIDAPNELNRIIALDSKNHSLTKLDSRIHIGFGAIGKGYALDVVRREIESQGFDNFRLVSGGSSIIFSGFSAPGEPWQWGWAWKKDNDGDWVGTPITHASGKSIALGISGLQEQNNHIIGGCESMLSALVAHESAEVADALSTALFVGGWERSESWFSAMLRSPAAAIIDGAEIPSWNHRFQELWGSLDDDEESFERMGFAKNAIATAFYGLMFSILDGFESIAHGQEEVNLDDFGVDDFTPYLYERDPYWIILPVAMILFVLWHLKQYRPSVKTLARSNRRESGFTSAKKQSLKELIQTNEKKSVTQKEK